MLIVGTGDVEKYFIQSKVLEMSEQVPFPKPPCIGTVNNHNFSNLITVTSSYVVAPFECSIRVY